MNLPKSTIFIKFETFLCKLFQFGQALVFTCLLYNSFENPVKKGEIGLNKQFLPQCFYTFGELSTIFIKFETFLCKLFQFGRV